MHGIFSFVVGFICFHRLLLFVRRIRVISCLGLWFEVLVWGRWLLIPPFRSHFELGAAGVNVERSAQARSVRGNTVWRIIRRARAADQKPVCHSDLRLTRASLDKVDAIHPSEAGREYLVGLW